MEAMKATTLPDMFFERVRLSGPREAVLRKEEGAWVPMTWDQLDTAVRETARGLSDWVAPGDRVAILSENRPEWWIADLAVLALGAVSVPVYPTSPPKDIAYILRDAGVRVLFVSNATQLAKIEGMRVEARIPDLRAVVMFDERAPEGAWLLSLGDLRTRNPSAGDVVAERAAGIAPDDLATLIYTSGTTGEPKGVMLSHRNLLSNAEGARVVLDHLDLDEFRTLSFLPLSHSLERTAGYYVAIRFGHTVAFAESIEKLVDNMQEVRPTLLVSVPRIYEKLYTRVMESAGEGAKKEILEWALKVGRRHSAYRLKDERPPPLLAVQNAVADRLVFSKVRERMGGRLRYAISGGAPLMPEIAWFLNALGLTVFEGYGLTETSPILAANRPGGVKVGTVGATWPDVTLKIAPEDEWGGEGEGEILAKGPGIMLGYFNKPGQTKAVIDDDGWFHTGDVGFVDDQGMVHITDRKKELLKTSGGKYVAPAPIENALKVDPLVEQAVLVGDRRNYCVALIVPAFEVLQSRLGRVVPGERLNRDPEVRRLFEKVVGSVNEELGSWERIKRFHLLPSELTQEGGELTPTLKVKRRVIDEKYREVIDALYQRTEPSAEAPPRAEVR